MKKCARFLTSVPLVSAKPYPPVSTSQVPSSCLETTAIPKPEIVSYVSARRSRNQRINNSNTRRAAKMTSCLPKPISGR
ncbi:hypothetical protein DL96DRAFT_1649688 [Flagelloscypha sp. PMI_526]|nr:hypothetical protein DL96DRAFT_1649688 [Flagelloscypha sp. PMI_526]